MKKSSIKDRIIRAGTITVIGSGISLLLGIIVRMVIARVYGPEGMGEYAGFMMFLSLFGTIAVFALPRAVLKYVAEYEESDQLGRARLIFSSIFFLLSAVSVVVAMGAQFFIPSLAELIHLPVDRTIALLLGLTLILATQSMLTATLFLGILQNLRAFIVSISSMLAMLCAAGYVFLVAPIPVYLLIVAGYMVSGVIGTIMAYRQGFLRIKFSGEEIREAFRFALPLILMSYVGFFAEWFDRFTLGLYFGVEEMGLFSAGLVIFTAARRLPLSLTEVLVPSYSKISLQGKEVLARAYGRNIFFYGILFFFISIALLLFRNELITLLFTEKFLPAADILLILGGAFILSVITNPGSALLVGCGHTRLNTINYIIGVIVLIPSLLILTRLWGLRGAAAARILAHLVTTSGMVFILARIVKLKISFLPLVKLLAVAVLSGLITWWVKPYISFFPLSILLLIVLYFGVIWLFVLSSKDKDYLLEIWQKLRSGSDMLKEPGVDWQESDTS